jgi:hypothetical protein
MCAAATAAVAVASVQLRMDNSYEYIRIFLSVMMLKRGRTSSVQSAFSLTGGCLFTQRACL